MARKTTRTPARPFADLNADDWSTGSSSSLPGSRRPRPRDRGARAAVRRASLLSLEPRPVAAGDSRKPATPPRRWRCCASMASNGGRMPRWSAPGPFLGTPTALLLMAANATVTVCDPRTSAGHGYPRPTWWWRRRTPNSVSAPSLLGLSAVVDALDAGRRSGGRRPRGCCPPYPAATKTAPMPPATAVLRAGGATEPRRKTTVAQRRRHRDQAGAAAPRRGRPPAGRGRLLCSATPPRRRSSLGPRPARRAARTGS